MAEAALAALTIFATIWILWISQIGPEVALRVSPSSDIARIGVEITGPAQQVLAITRVGSRRGSSMYPRQTWRVYRVDVVQVGDGTKRSYRVGVSTRSPGEPLRWYDKRVRSDMWVRLDDDSDAPHAE